MKHHLTTIPGRLLLVMAAFIATNASHSAHADYVTSATLSFDLLGDTFANAGNAATWSSLGFPLTSGQSFLEFGAHSATALPWKPDPSVANFSELRESWVRPETSDLSYGYDPNASLQSFVFDPATVNTVGGSGNMRFTGGDSFWVANDGVIASMSHFIQYGDLSLSYSAASATGSNSGWLFSNNSPAVPGGVPLPMAVYDTRDVTILVSGSTLNLTGQLYIHSEFEQFGVQSGLHAGSFTLRATTVPEPGSMAVLGIFAAGGAAWRKRRQAAKSISAATC